MERETIIISMYTVCMIVAVVAIVVITKRMDKYIKENIKYMTTKGYSIKEVNELISDHNNSVEINKQARTNVINLLKYSNNINAKIVTLHRTFPESKHTADLFDKMIEEIDNYVKNGGDYAGSKD